MYTTQRPADDVKLGKFLYEKLFGEPVAAIRKSCKQPSKPTNQTQQHKTHKLHKAQKCGDTTFRICFHEFIFENPQPQPTTQKRRGAEAAASRHSKVGWPVERAESFQLVELHLPGDEEEDDAGADDEEEDFVLTENDLFPEILIPIAGHYVFLCIHSCLHTL